MGKFAKLAMVDVADTFGKTVREAALDLDQRIVLKTPVDTGRARSNWLVGLGAPMRRVRNTIDQGGGKTIAENARVIARQKRFQSIWISNNLPYIRELENGTSKQAPAGMVRQSVNETIRVFRNR